MNANYSQVLPTRHKDTERLKSLWAGRSPASEGTTNVDDKLGTTRLRPLRHPQTSGGTLRRHHSLRPFLLLYVPLLLPEMKPVVPGLAINTAP